MKNFPFRLSGIVVAAGLLGCVVWWIFFSAKQSAQPAGSASAPALPLPPGKEPALATAGTKAEPPAPQPVPAPLAAAAEAIKPTRDMYLAHAPLRVPEVADPDSATNREVLQTMVLKAFERAAPASK